MRLSFDTIEEIQEFVKRLKGTRGSKSSDENETPGTGGAPAPLMPPQQQPAQNFAPTAFAPPQQQPAPFPGAQPDPVMALVQRITTKLDSAIAAGQPVDQALTWFRTQCGPEAANATLDQIKGVFLPKLAMPTLENIAKLMNA